MGRTRNAVVPQDNAPDLVNRHLTPSRFLDRWTDPDRPDHSIRAIMNLPRAIIILVTLLSLLEPVRADDEPGHSRHGSAFDSGLRQRPWRMEGIGKTHFPITTRVPEVQEWFDQGNTLLHSFWYEEAERSFRWCLKLDPDCAMAYWGLARCGGETKRYLDFLDEAIRRKGLVSPRERMYIEAWE